MNMKMINAIMMIVSTSVGMGILGLPIVTANSGFFPTICSFGIAWIFMTLASFYILKIKMYLRGHYSLASMIKLTLGKSGHLFATIIILLLLYALLSTYLMAAVAWLKLLLPHLSKFHEFPIALGFTCLFVLIMVCREQRLYTINNILGLGVLLVFLAIIGGNLIPSHSAFMNQIDFKSTLPAFPLLLTTFGFSIVVPAITEYLQYDEVNTKRSIFWGSLISLIAYALWEWITLGNIPSVGQLSFETLKQTGDNGTGVIVALATLSDHPWIIYCGKLFAFLLVITSFLGISLALIHFLSDLLHFPIHDNRRLILSALMYIPPVMVIVFFPRAFVQFLSFAGIFVAILLGLFPVLMMIKLNDTFKNKALHLQGVNVGEIGNQDPITVVNLPSRFSENLAVMGFVGLFFILVIVQEIFNLYL